MLQNFLYFGNLENILFSQGLMELRKIFELRKILDSCMDL